MMSINSLAFLISKAGIARSAKETIERLELSGWADPKHAQTVIAVLAAFNAEEGWSVTVRDGESDSLELDAISGEEVNLIIRKPSEGRVFFATNEGFRGALRDPALARVSEVHVLGAFSPFSTRRFLVNPWDGSPLPGLPPSLPVPSAEPADPRRGLVRDLTGVEVSEDTLRWLPVGGNGEGEVWELWRSEAAKRLALIPTSEVWTEAAHLKVCLHGARKRSFLFDAAALDAAQEFDKLTEAAEWVVMDRGAEARHEMLIRRLATIVPETDSWCGTMPGALIEALEGAKIDYRAYARSKSAETLKAMADLRKAVGDDVARIVERAQRLSNGLIASIVALTAGIGLRLALTVAKGNFLPGLIFGLTVLGAAWAAISMQRHINGQSLRDDLNNMRKWHRNVHSSLSKKEYCDIALHPINDAVKLYKRTLRDTGRWMYLSSITFLIIILIIPSCSGK